MPHLKICGITRVEDLVACHELGVDYIGFNFYPGSRRYILPEHAAKIWSEFRMAHPLSTLKPVAVSVDAARDELVALFRTVPELAAVQLHGAEPVDFVAELKRCFAVEIWKALPVSGASVRGEIAAFSTAADLILLDSAAVAPGANVPGGSGKTFNWSEFADVIASPGIGVAGGIHPANISDLLKFRPQMIDIASGAETSPGVKSREKIESLITACRNLI